MNLRQLNNIFRQVLMKRISNSRRIQMLRNSGMLIGNGCVIANSARFSEPYLVKLGNRVRITNEVAFITHQGATWVFRQRNKK